jgi:hypothetical protein
MQFLVFVSIGVTLRFVFVSCRNALANSVTKGLLDYFAGRRSLHNPFAERMKEKSEVTPSAMSVQTKKKAPLDLAISAPTPAPIMWTTGTDNPRSDRTRMMMYPDLRSMSTRVPYNQTVRIGKAMRFEVPPFSNPRVMSSAR